VRVIPVPAQLDERTFDQLVQPLDVEAGERVLVDARKVRWVDPYGMLGLLAVGDVAAAGGERPILQLPESSDIISYLARMRFFDQAEELYEMHGGARRTTEGVSEVLLEITPIRSHNDVHTVIDKVHASAMVILMKQLNFAREEAMHFSVLLSELCQNIIEHAQADGWVATQTYSKTPQLARRVVKIAVMDLGVGFKGSLNSSLAARYGDRWSDATALEAAFMHGLTRFHDPGRGQGLQQIRKQVGKLGGKIAIRSGTARIADVPDWEDTPPLEEKLPTFPGSQISVVLPAREAADQKPAATTTSSSKTRRRSS
jgi:anti-sigma regulatory factor (Ser/Thr protein kinase)